MQYDATPSASPLNAVIGFSQGTQTAYTGFAALTRFNQSGSIDARNGGAYAAQSAVPFSAGLTYHFRLVINIPADTYWIFVTPREGRSRRWAQTLLSAPSRTRSRRWTRGDWM